MLVEKTRNLKVTAEAVQGNYVFQVEYLFDSTTLEKCSCQVYKKTENELQDYIGNMSLEKGNKNICIRENEDLAELLPTFESIIAEVKATLVEPTEPATAEK